MVPVRLSNGWEKVGMTLGRWRCGGCRGVEEAELEMEEHGGGEGGMGPMQDTHMGQSST